MTRSKRHCARVFKAVCDEKRINILQLLKSGEKCTCVILDVLDMKPSCLLHHMKFLCDSGIVESREVGRWTYYKISETGSVHAVRLLKELTTIEETKEYCCK